MTVRYELTPSRALGRLFPALLVVGAGLLVALAFVLALVLAVVGGSAPAGAVEAPGPVYVPPTLQHACTWDGSRTGTINPAITPENTPGNRYVLGPDGQPVMATNGKPVEYPAWLIGRYGDGVIRGVNGLHWPEFDWALGEVLGRKPTPVELKDAQCVQDQAVLSAAHGMHMTDGTPLNPGLRQMFWTADDWDINITHPIPRTARLAKAGGLEHIAEVERQLAEIRAGRVEGWRQDDRGVWRRKLWTKAPGSAWYRPGRMSTSWLGTDLVRAGGRQ